MFSLMKLLLRVSHPSQAFHAKLPVLYTIVTSPSMAVFQAPPLFHRFAILPENAAIKLRGKSREFAAAHPALAHPALNSKLPAVRMQSAHLLFVKDAPVR